MSQITFHTPKFPLSLTDQTVHIWCAPLVGSLASLDRMMSLLSKDEIARAKRFYYDEHRQSYIFARGTLRQILSCYLQIPPEKIQFQSNAYGKPGLVEDQNALNLQFNLSHSKQLAVFAVVKHHQVGIDIEWLRDNVPFNDLAQRFFSAKEAAEIANLSSDQQKQAFFNTWTRKEAVIKALGMGLFIALNKFSVTTSLTEPPALLHLGDDVTVKETWSLVPFIPAPEYIATLAIPFIAQDIKYWQFS